MSLIGLINALDDEAEQRSKQQRRQIMKLKQELKKANEKIAELKIEKEDLEVMVFRLQNELDKLKQKN